MKVLLESGFVGYVLGSEFFIIGSIVEAFENKPSHPREFATIKRETGTVKAVL